jgi:hypothetical protein
MTAAKLGVGKDISKPVMWSRKFRFFPVKRYGRGFSNAKYFRQFYHIFSDRIPAIGHFAGGQSASYRTGDRAIWSKRNKYQGDDIQNRLNLQFLRKQKPFTSPPMWHQPQPKCVLSRSQMKSSQFLPTTRPPMSKFRHLNPRVHENWCNFAVSSL